MAWCQISDKPLSEQMVVKSIDAYMHHSASMSQMFQYIIIVGLRPALEGFVVTMHEGACETGSQIPTA